LSGGGARKSKKVFIDFGPDVLPRNVFSATLAQPEILFGEFQIGKNCDVILVTFFGDVMVMTSLK